MIRQFIAAFFFPTKVAMGLLIAGLALQFSRKRQKTGRWMTAAGILVFYVFSTGMAAQMLLGPLEYRFAAFDPARPDAGSVRAVVVLTGGAFPPNGLSAVDRLTDETLARLIEGVRIHRAIEGSRLIISGGNPSGMVVEADAARELALALGVAPDRMRLERDGKNTAAQALALRADLGKAPFVLVTSARHMPRSVAYFQHAGMHPIPAPAGYLLKSVPDGVSLKLLIPSASSLHRSESAIYEYLGLVWVWITGAT